MVTPLLPGHNDVRWKNECDTTRWEICNVDSPWLCAPEPPVSSATRSHVSLGCCDRDTLSCGMFATLFSLREKKLVFPSLFSFSLLFFSRCSVYFRCALFRLRIICVASVFARCIATNHRPVPNSHSLVHSSLEILSKIYSTSLSRRP